MSTIQSPPLSEHLPTVNQFSSFILYNSYLYKGDAFLDLPGKLVTFALKLFILLLQLRVLRVVAAHIESLEDQLRFFNRVFNLVDVKLRLRNELLLGQGVLTYVFSIVKLRLAMFGVDLVSDFCEVRSI